MTTRQNSAGTAWLAEVLRLQLCECGRRSRMHPSCAGNLRARMPQVDDRPLDARGDVRQSRWGGFENDPFDVAAHEYQLDAVGKPVDELLDGEGVQAELDFVRSEQLFGRRAIGMQPGFVVDNHPFAAERLEQAIDGAA